MHSANDFAVPDLLSTKSRCDGVTRAGSLGEWLPGRAELAAGNEAVEGQGGMSPPQAAASQRCQLPPVLAEAPQGSVDPAVQVLCTAEEKSFCVDVTQDSLFRQCLFYWDSSEDLTHHASSCLSRNFSQRSFETLASSFIKRQRPLQ